MYTNDDIKTEFDKWWATKTAAGYEYGREALENVEFGFEAGFEAGHSWYLGQITREREQLREQNARSRRMQREARNSPHYRKMT